MDMSYATILVFGEERGLYRETWSAYMVSSRDNPNNHPIYAIDTDLGSPIFYNDLHFEEENQNNIKLIEKKMSNCKHS